MNEMIPQFKETSIAVNYEKETADKPGLIHKYCPGLAVTMSYFGLFTVTHVPTGLSMCGSFERHGTAVGIMIKYQLIAKEHGFSWAEHMEETMKPLLELEVPFDGTAVISKDGARKQTIREWIQGIKMTPFIEEFPWEEKHPLDIANDDLERLAP